MQNVTCVPLVEDLLELYVPLYPHTWLELLVNASSLMFWDLSPVRLWKLVVDYFTKWPEAHPLPNQEAATVAEALVKEYVCRFGVPLSLHSDQGRNFESNLFQEMCKLLGIRKTRTTPLHPQSDGLVERRNRTLEFQLSKFVSKSQSNWDHYLPFMMLALRSVTQESTKSTSQYYN